MNPKSDFFSPSGLNFAEAARGIKSLGIGAHADDLDFMCLAAIEGGDFFGVVASDGRGSARGEAFKNLTEAEFIEVRRNEQRAAARQMGYRGLLQLGFPSADVRKASNAGIEKELTAILENTRPEVLYTHSIFDKHPTHRALALHVMHAVRALPKNQRPKRVLGCEVWRSLDWVPAKKRVSLPLKSTESEMKSLFSLYRSQIDGAKNYADAVVGRKRCNATFSESHSRDSAEFLEFAVDMTKLAHGNSTLQDFAEDFLGAFQREIFSELKLSSRKKNGNHHSKKSRSRLPSRRKRPR
jgi:LmbE family N-acetylglucosaminyl deacetylase